MHVLRTLTGHDTVSEDCAPAVREGLLEAQVDETDEILSFRSALVRDAVYGSLPAARRRALHRCAADLTGGTAHWRHLVGSTDGPDAGLADALEKAATAEFEQGALVAAAEYLLWAAARSPDERARAARLTEGVRLLVHAAREGHALTHTAEIEALPDGPARSELLGLLAFARDEVTASRDLLVAARAGMVDGTVPGESVARLDLELAYVHCQLGDGEAAVRAADDARRQIPEEHRLAPLARAFLAAGTALTEGPARGLEHLAFLPTSPARATPYELAALTQRGILNGLLGRLAPACADLTVVARRRGTPLAHLLGVSAQVHLIWCDYLLGEWDAARRELEVAVEAVTRHGRSFDHATLWSLSSILHAGRGEHDAARADLARARMLAETADFLGPRIHLTLADAAIAQAEGRAGDVASALSALTPDELEPDRVQLYSGWWLPALVDSHLDTGRLDSAARALAALDRVPSAGSCLPVARAWLAGRLAAALGDLPGARRAFEAGLALPADGGEPGWYRTRLRHAYGATLVLAGHRSAGRTALDAAADAYSRLGARPFLERCLADLADAADPADLAVGAVGPPRPAAAGPTTSPTASGRSRRSSGAGGRTPRSPPSCSSRPRPSSTTCATSTGSSASAAGARCATGCRAASPGLVQVVVLHQAAARLGDRARERRVDRERVGEVVHRQVVLHGHGQRQDQLAGHRRHDHPADDDARRRPAEHLDEALAQAGHLRPRVRAQRHDDLAGVELPALHLGVADADGGDLGAGEHRRGDGLEPQRGDALAQRVPHRDPALHGRDRRQRQEAGAVAGGVDAGDRGAGDAVDVDVAALAQLQADVGRRRGRRCWAPSRRSSARATPRPRARRTASPARRRRWRRPCRPASAARWSRRAR